uniref:Uncharacterized protein n=1 Tax=Anopheles coluzzii TaxID=1518534 RepID=A0A8W7NZU2_ANOCL
LPFRLPTDKRRLGPLYTLAVVTQRTCIAEPHGQILHVALQLVLPIVAHDDQGRLHLLVLLARDPTAHLLLQQRYDVRYHVVPLLLQRKQRLRRTDEYFRLTKPHIVAKVFLVHQHLHAVPIVATAEVWPGVLGNHFVAEQKFVVPLTVHKPGPSYTHILQQAQVSDLVLHAHIIEHGRTLDIVRLNAPYVQWLFAQKCGHQLCHRFLEQRSCGQRALCSFRNILCTFGPHRADHLIMRTVKQTLEILE